MFFVSGITGHVGGAVAERLLASGHELRALVRDPQKAAAWADKGVEVRQGDLTDSAALAAALDGVEGAFVMVPPKLTPAPGYPESAAVIASLVAAVSKTPVPRLVGLSSIGSEKTSGLGLITATHMLEQALNTLETPKAFVRAGSFFENAVPGLGVAKATGVMYTFYTPLTRAVPMIATVDIGAQIATLLMGPVWTGTKIVELGSRVTPEEMAAAMGEAVGRTVTAQAIPRNRWAATCESFGMPTGSSWAYEEMMDGVNSGWIDFGVEGTEAVAGTTAAKDVFASAIAG